MHPYLYVFFAWLAIGSLLGAAFVWLSFGTADAPLALPSRREAASTFLWTVLLWLPAAVVMAFFVLWFWDLFPLLRQIESDEPPLSP